MVSFLVVKGKYYAWDPNVLNILVGDIVVFEWEPPPYVSNMFYKVEQTPDLGSPADGTGFSSGEASISGTIRRSKYMFVTSPYLHNTVLFTFAS